MVRPSDLDVVRDQYAAVNERDFDRAMSHYADDVKMVIPPGDIDAGTFSGREEVGRWFGRWFGSFDESLRFEIAELTDLPDGRVLLVADATARGRASGAEVTMTVVWTYRLRDGRIAEVRRHWSREDVVAG